MVDGLGKVRNETDNRKRRIGDWEIGRNREEENGRYGEFIEMKLIRSHKELEVYKLAYKLAMDIYLLTKDFPIEEKYSLTDQIRRSSRSVTSNIAEAFRKRRYGKAFIAKLSDSEGEAAETQTWLDYSRDCGYINTDICEKYNQEYEFVIGM